MNNVTHKFLSMYLFLTLYMFRAHRAHHQEGQIVSVQPLVAVTVLMAMSCAGWEFHGHQQSIQTLVAVIVLVVMSCASWEFHSQPAHDTTTDNYQSCIDTVCLSS
jgi:hypothetical protein